MKIDDQEFDGPYTIDQADEVLSDVAVVYVILDHYGGKYAVLDVGESGEAATRLANHDRKRCWDRAANGQVEVCVKAFPSKSGYTFEHRRRLEKSIRERYNPPCGKI